MIFCLDLLFWLFLMKKNEKLSFLTHYYYTQILIFIHISFLIGCRRASTKRMYWWSIWAYDWPVYIKDFTIKHITYATSPTILFSYPNILFKSTFLIASDWRFRKSPWHFSRCNTLWIIKRVLLSVIRKKSFSISQKKSGRLKSCVQCVKYSVH